MAEIQKTPSLTFQTIIIFTIAFLVRFLFLLFTRENPLVIPKVAGLDPYLYNQLAGSFLAGNFFDPQSLWAMPLYPYILALFFKISGMSLLGVRFWQIVIGSVNCVLIYKIGEKLFNRRVGIIAGVIASVYAPFVFHEMILISFFLKVFLGLSAILLILNYFENPDRLKLILAGLVSGLLMLTSGASIIFVLGIFLMMLVKERRPAVIFLLAVCCALLPFTVRNYLISGEVIPFSAHSGINFYIGNNPRANGAYQPLAGQHAGSDILNATARAEAELASGRKLTAKEVSSFWSDKALVFIRANPGQYFRLLMRKVRLFLSPTENYDVLDCDFLRKYFIKLKIPLFSFGFIFPLGLIGIYLSGRDWRKLKILYLVMFSVFLSTILFFVNARYRLEIMPAVILFAAVSVSVIFDQLRRRGYRKAVTILLSFLILMGLLNLLRTNPPKESISFYNLGNHYFALGDDGQALEFYRRASLIDPGYANAYFGLGNVCYKKLLYPDSIICYKRTIKLEPNHFRAYNNLGSVYSDLDELDKALICFKKANQINPNYPMIHENIRMIEERLQE